jgi:disulfide bond formation protein DsbB
MLDMLGGNMARSRKLFFFLFITSATIVGVAILFFVRGSASTVIPREATDIQSNSACGSGSCSKTFSYLIAKPTGAVIRFYEDKGFQCDKIQFESDRLFPSLPMPHWLCKKQETDGPIFIGFAAEDSVKTDRSLRVYGWYSTRS